MGDAVRELLLLRHGEAEWPAGGTPDLERALTARGGRDARQVGAWLRAQGLVPDAIVSSPARRARETAGHVLETPAAAFDDRIYEADIPDLLGALADVTGQRVLLVGHNPGLAELVRFLPRGAPASASFPTAALAHLRLPADWSRLTADCGELVAIIRPAASA